MQFSFSFLIETFCIVGLVVYAIKLSLHKRVLTIQTDETSQSVPYILLGKRGREGRRYTQYTQFSLLKMFSCMNEKNQSNNVNADGILLFVLS